MDEYSRNSAAIFVISFEDDYSGPAPYRTSPNKLVDFQIKTDPELWTPTFYGSDLIIFLDLSWQTLNTKAEHFQNNKYNST